METVAYLKGVLADGHIYERKNTIRIVARQKDGEWLNYISSIITRTFNIETRIIKTNDNVWMLWSYIKKSDIQSEILEILLKPLNETRFEDDKDKIAFVKGF